MVMKKIKLAGLTDTGKKRTTNQDCFILNDIKTSPLPDTVFIAVADGMGGHAGGEIASKLALDSVISSLKSSGQNSKIDGAMDFNTALIKANQFSNNTVIQKADDNYRLTGMGTTLTSALLTGNMILFTNVGDSRGYLIRNNTITQITQDHSLVAEQIRAGYLSEEEAKIHPQRNVITRAIGISAHLDVDIFKKELCNGDIVVLCSDGLYPLVSDTEILKHIQSKDLQQGCEKLVGLANERGGPDNITIATAKFEGKPDKQAITMKKNTKIKTTKQQTWMKRIFLFLK